ncbi:MAG: OmpA family protein [Bacteroidales bacterium]|nr:OmpA family protein [Bacteroidales bacterium]
MLKKVIKLGVVMSLMLTSISALAQNSGKMEYPRYGFWSNWSIGGAFDLNWEIRQGPLGFTEDWWRASTNIGMDLILQQKLNHVFDWRLRFGGPTWGRPRTDTLTNKAMDRHWTISADVLFSINNAILGYNPDRRFNLYIFGGAGAKFSGSLFNKEDEERDNTNWNQGRIGVLVDGGIGASWRFGESHHIFAEYSFDFTDIPDIFVSDLNTYERWHNTNNIMRVGYFYCFGPTATDKAIAAQKAMLTQENFSALNAQVNNLERQVAGSRNNEKRLENRIAELEDQLAQALAQAGPGGNSAAADSLQAVIDQIKADQLTFYAMPFSVQYGVDEWNVSEDEEAKVKAVARVLKDNPDVKVLVVGFADYTGSDSYNMKLSEKRANEVKRLLTKRYGIAEDRIQTEYKGKSVAFGDIQYALNRRVSFYRVIE